MRISDWSSDMCSSDLGRLFTPEEGGGTAAGLFRYSSVINWFRPPAGQPPGHHEGRGVLRPIGDALGVVLAAILLVWAVLYVTKGRFLKSPAERIATRLTGSEVKVTGDFQLYFNTLNIKFLAEGLTVANHDWAEGRQLFSANIG